MKIKDIKTAPYNPRKMSKEARRALRSSIEQFNDISGITINSRTGNVLAGNHRWDELVTKYKKANLVLEPLKGEYHLINLKNGDSTGFIARVVDWDEVKEKAANIAANSDLISGDFTSGLQDILLEIAPLMDGDGFEDLRLDELTIDLDGIDDDFDWDNEASERIREQAEENNKKLSDKGEEVPPVKEVLVNIKLVMPSDLRDEVKEAVLEWLSQHDEFADVQVV